MESMSQKARMGTEQNQNAVNYVVNLITSLLGGVQVTVNRNESLNYSFYIVEHDLKISFGRSTMDDYQSLFESKQKGDQFQGLQNFIRFLIYVALGKPGLIPKFSVARELLAERRDWLKDIRVRLEKQKQLYEIFYEGLKILAEFIRDISNKYAISSDEIRKEQEDINHLIAFYEQNHHFNDGGVSEETLGYFKAAAVCLILKKEKEKETIPFPRGVKAKDVEIYSIVEELRKDQFPQIKMPACINDYAEFVTSGSAREEIVEPREGLIFVACGQSADEEKRLGSRIKEHLKDKYGLNAFLAESVNDLEALNSHIFRNLGNCTGLIAILHKRGQGKHDTSVWINQEVGIIAFLKSTGKQIPSLVLYQNDAAVEGLIKYTIANPPTFGSDDEAVLIIERWVADQNFKYAKKLPEIDVILTEKRGRFGSTQGGGRQGYYNVKYALTFRIRNKSDVNVCLEDIKVDHSVLGAGILDKTNPRLSRLPLNVGPRMTEEVNLCINFPNEVDPEKVEEEMPLQFYLEFADRTIEADIVGYFQK
jgi:hypothetical protein